MWMLDVASLVGTSWERPPRIVAHRGAPEAAPENTLMSLQAAVAAGAGAVELDARLTRDDVLVLHHDATLGRIVPGDASIEQTTWDELSRLEAEITVQAGKVTAPFARLDVVLRALPDDVLVDVELKADGERVDELARRAHEVIEDAAAGERALVTSFYPAVADDYARRSGRPAGIILPFVPEPEDVLDWPRLTHVALHAGAATPETIAWLAEEGRTTLVWTVNDVETARRLLSRPVASVITDRAEKLVSRLRPDGLAP